MALKTQKTTPEHEAVYQELAAVMKKHEVAGAAPDELLAILSNMVGKVLAMQDQRRPAAAYMDLIAENIEKGNAQMIAQLKGATPVGRA